MTSSISVRVFRGGTVELASVGRIRGALTDKASVWVDVAATAGGWADVADQLEAELGLVQHAVDLKQLAAEGAPPRVKILGDGTVIVRAYALRMEAGRVRAAEYHAVAGSRYLLTLRHPEDGGPPPDPPTGVVERLEAAAGSGSPEGLRLLYVLLDELGDTALETVNALDEAADALEDRVFAPPEGQGRREARLQHQEIQRDILALRRELGDFRRRVLPYGEVRELVQEETRRSPNDRSYFREVAEMVLRILELSDNVRDLLTSEFEAELAQISRETNDIMKKVTSWAAILLVPTLIAGIYGMNFRHMPELGWGLGYPGALGLMAASAFGLWLVFRRQDWL